MCFRDFSLCLFRCHFFIGPGRVQDGFGAQHGSNLGRFWPLFGTFLGVLLASQLKIAFKTILCRTLIALGPPGEWKMCKNRWFLWVETKMRVFVLWSLLRPILDRFWLILDSKIVPKSVPRGSGRVLEIMAVFACLREPPKINFLHLEMRAWKLIAEKSIFSRFWARFGVQKWAEKRLKSDSVFRRYGSQSQTT